MSSTIIGLERLLDSKEEQNKIKGNIAYLCHSASVDRDYNIGIIGLKKVFGDRLKKIFGPQHGLVSDVQDNMVETDHYIHPFFQLPVYSLYSETRIPTDEMLEGIDTFIVDLQDVGTRVYTYISTMTYTMAACAKKGIRLVILDRPNPVGGEMIEGTVLQEGYESFVGVLPIAQRHAMTMAEVALFAKEQQQIDVDLQIIQMENWNRSMHWNETKRDWVNPSPNLPTPQSSLTFCGTVLYEGTNVSEGRGTTRSLEVIGHPALEPYQFLDKRSDLFSKFEGIALRPLVFMPTFQKHAGTPCGGLHIHPTESSKAQTWRLGQVLMRELYHELGDNFEWNTKPYEYEFDKIAIDLINGTDSLRKWIEKKGTLEELIAIESDGLETFLNLRENSLIYK